MRTNPAPAWLPKTVLCILSVLPLSGCNLFNGYAMNRSGQRYYQSGRFAAARDEFKRAAADHPGNADYLTNMALATRRQGDLREAERIYRHAINFDPSHQPSHHGLAQLLVDQNRTAEAHSLLQAWVASQPYSPEAHVEMAWLQGRTGDSSGASASLQQALQLNPNHPAALAQMGQHYDKAGQQRLATAMYQRSLYNNWYQPQVHRRVQAMRSAPAYAAPSRGGSPGTSPIQPTIPPGPFAQPRPSWTASTPVSAAPGTGSVVPGSRPRPAATAPIRFPNADPAHVPTVGPDVTYVAPF